MNEHDRAPMLGESAAFSVAPIAARENGGATTDDDHRRLRYVQCGAVGKVYPERTERVVVQSIEQIFRRHG